MTIMECPGCRHLRSAHREGRCYRLEERTTTMGENFLALCGFCGWEPVITDTGIRGWHRVDSDRGEFPDQSTVEAETVASAIAEVERILSMR